MNEYDILFRQAEREILQWSGSSVKEILWRDGLLLAIHQAQKAESIDEARSLMDQILRKITDSGPKSLDFAPALHLINEALIKLDQHKDEL